MKEKLFLKNPGYLPDSWILKLAGHFSVHSKCHDFGIQYLLWYFRLVLSGAAPYETKVVQTSCYPERIYFEPLDLYPFLQREFSERDREMWMLLNFIELIRIFHIRYQHNFWDLDMGYIS